jgi:hypothetical protein
MRRGKEREGGRKWVWKSERLRDVEIYKGVKMLN